MTEVGKCVLQSARRIVAELDCLGDEFQLMNSGMGGVLTIGTRTISGQPFLSRVTAAFEGSEGDIRREVGEFVAQLRTRGLLES